MNKWIGIGVVMCLGACNDDNGGTSDATSDSGSDATSGSDSTSDSDSDSDSGSDSGSDSTSDSDSGSDSTPDPETVAETTPEVTDEVTPGPYGFSIRLPRTDLEPPCSETPSFGDPSYVFKADDADYLCTFDYGGTQATLYFQSSPTGCAPGGFMPLPVFTTLAWSSRNSIATPLTAAHYDIGGNHHNDTIEFAFDGTYYRYGHSSMGFGGRACAPPDCLQRLDDATHTEVTDDGCTPARTHPIVCRDIAADGTFGSLEDTFTKCLGDPNRN